MDYAFDLAAIFVQHYAKAGTVTVIHSFRGVDKTNR